MVTHHTLGENDIGTAWATLEDWEDESPRAFGLELPLGRAVRDRDGVHRYRASAADFTCLTDPHVTDVEDALIDDLDRARASAA